MFGTEKVTEYTEAEKGDSKYWWRKGDVEFSERKKWRKIQFDKMSSHSDEVLIGRQWHHRSLSPEIEERNMR